MARPRQITESITPSSARTPSTQGLVFLLVPTLCVGIHTGSSLGIFWLALLGHMHSHAERGNEETYKPQRRKVREEKPYLLVPTLCVGIHTGSGLGIFWLALLEHMHSHAERGNEETYKPQRRKAREEKHLFTCSHALRGNEDKNFASFESLRFSSSFCYPRP